MAELLRELVEFNFPINVLRTRFIFLLFNSFSSFFHNLQRQTSPL